MSSFNGEVVKVFQRGVCEIWEGRGGICNGQGAADMGKLVGNMLLGARYTTAEWLRHIRGR